MLSSIYLFILGLAFGSFALVLADRMHSKKDWIRGRSHCDSCNHVLSPIDMVPIFSWLSTWGKCRYCKINLSMFYPLTELGLGIAFLASFIFWPYGLVGVLSILSFSIWLTALVIMTSLAVFDIKWYRLPNKLVYPLILLGLLETILDFINKGVSSTLFIQYGLSLFVGAGIFLILFGFSKGKWIGDGDVRLGIAIGLFASTPILSWLTIFLASILGILVGLPVIFKKKDTKNILSLKIPFGPVLILALIIVVLFGQSMVDWYSASIMLF